MGDRLGIFFLVAAWTVIINLLPAFGQASPYILGSTADQQTARNLGLQGNFVDSPSDVPEGSNVLVLGSMEAAGGVDILDFLNLHAMDCLLIRLGGIPGVTLTEEVKAYKKLVDSGKDPFADIPRSQGSTASPIHFSQLAGLTFDKPERQSLDPKYNCKVLFPINDPINSNDPLLPPDQNPSKLGERLTKLGKLVLNINFEPQSANLKANSIPLVERIMQMLKLDPGLRIVIEGHTDNYQDPSYNQDLSEQRARAVKTWLVEHGISGVRLRTRGKGETQPIATNETTAGRARNRRVEIIKDN